MKNVVDNIISSSSASSSSISSFSEGEDDICFAIRGSCFDSTGSSSLGAVVRHISDGVCFVDRRGKILLVDEATSHLDELNSVSARNRLVELSPTQFLTPGFVDSHIHAPQMIYAGLGLDLPLLQWLQRYTFPSERRFEERQVAQAEYPISVRRLLRCGTTTAMYFGTLHQEATKELAETTRKLGQRALIGKVCIDQNGLNGYCHSTQKNVEETEKFILHLLSGCRSWPPASSFSLLSSSLFKDSDDNVKILPVVTPRFIPSCSLELLGELGRLARRYDCHVQSHISESEDEIKFVQSLHHPHFSSDAEIFAKYGLLTSKAIMAHALYLSNEDHHRLASHGTAVSHCPLSNYYFAGKCLDVARLVKGNREGGGGGISVALGSDVSGGYSPSMLDAMRHAMITSKIIENQRIDLKENLREIALIHDDNNYDNNENSKDNIDNTNDDENEFGHSDNQCLHTSSAFPCTSSFCSSSSKVSLAFAFYLATFGGAKALGLEEQIGTLEDGKEFDALVWDAGGEEESLDLYGEEWTKEQLFQKTMYLGDDRNIVKVWVKGREVMVKT